MKYIVGGIVNVVVLVQCEADSKEEAIKEAYNKCPELKTYPEANTKAVKLLGVTDINTAEIILHSGKINYEEVFEGE